jgi:hypothetical protein
VERWPIPHKIILLEKAKNGSQKYLLVLSSEIVKGQAREKKTIENTPNPGRENLHTFEMACQAEK